MEEAFYTFDIDRFELMLACFVGLVMSERT